MVKLYKLDASPPARACMVACELFNVPVELIDVNLLEGEHLKPEFLKKNPLHTVPVLEDGSLVIHESHAALMYLADVYGKQESFYPKDTKQRVFVNQKLFFNSTILFPRLRNITYPIIMEGMKEIPQKSLDAIEEAYGFLEEFLSRTKYLAGDNITIADIAAYATVTSLLILLELNAQKYPKTQAWLKDLEKRPYVQKGNAKESEPSTTEASTEGPSYRCGVPALTCPPHEEYSSCIQSGCTAKNCSQLGKPVPCIKIDPKYCIEGCVCKTGYLRNAKGMCVPKDQCKTKCGLNEVFSDCPNPCPPRKCNLKDAVFKCKAPPKPGDPECKPGCICANNYYRNATGSCVLKKNCEKPLKCPKNEQYDPCMKICPPQKCGVNPALILCLPNPEYGDPNCKQGCICKDLEVRNDAGQCVPKDKCPKCTGQNEYFEPCIQGCSNQTCGSIGQKYFCPFQKGCKSGCRCKPGIYRKDVGSTCSLTEEQCTKGKCPPGERWNPCPAIKCDADYCAKNKDSPKWCPIGIVCDPARCECEINKKRDRKTGKCIPVADCPPFPCPCNEEYRFCPPPCPGESCLAYITGPLAGKCPPKEPGTRCTPQCKCCEGYSRNDNGTCIPSKHCIKTTTTSTTTTVKPPTANTGDRGSGLSGLLDGITAFTGKCLYERMQSAPNENIIMSAMSVFNPIAQLCLYSNGPAFDQCIKILNLKDKQDIRDTFAKFSTLYEGVTSVNFSTAAKVYSSDKYPLSDGFIKDTVDVFHAAAQVIDFIKNIEAADIINAWVESKTNDRITDLVSPDMFSDSTILVLINAIYFKAKWLNEFNENNTKEEDFYLSDGSITKTKLMNQEIKDLEYGDDASLDCKVVRIPYTGGESSAIIVLPNSINGTMQLAKTLQVPANWKKLLDSLSPQKVQLYLPKFVISTTTDLKDLLKKANITNWFDCGNSGLSGLLAKPEDICISEAIQKAWCEFNEVGTEATAANVFVGITTTAVRPPPPPPKIFRADHSFLFYVSVKSTVMFQGHIASQPTD